jgi:small subunit ribosomal protein S2
MPSVKIRGQGLASSAHDTEVTIKDLLESGAHFGHQRRRWNPKMKRYIFEERNGIYIIDLAKTMQQIRNAVQVVKDTVAKRKSILFVGTKKQAKSVIKECAEECGEFYVCERWLGGALTNLSTIRQSVKTLERFEKRLATGGEGFTKKEMSLTGKELIKLNRNLSGIRAMRKPPGLLIVVDPSLEHIAVAEANKLGIPVMALVDTNCDPDPIDHVIACNDDALKSIKLILTALTNAVLAKKGELKLKVSKDEEKQEEESAEEGEEAEKETT